MFVTSLLADAFATNCYVLALDHGKRCVVVDPGYGVADRLTDLLAHRQIQPVAVLVTHGHIDHTFSAAVISETWDIPVYVHPADRQQLSDPRAGVSSDLYALFGEAFTWSEPGNVREFQGGDVVHLAGMDCGITHVPGHTPGSVLLRVEDGKDTVCLTGDVLFAGSVGRTDLPGGDREAMMASLSHEIMTLPDDMVVFPGHGRQTTIGRERDTNPFLRGIR